MTLTKRRSQRKRRNQIIIASAALLIVIVIVYVLITARPDFITFPTKTPSPGTYSIPTIGPNTPTPFHWHLHIDIFINGTPVVLPGDLGHVVDDVEYYAVHVHGADGVLHVEYSSPITLTLTNVFQVWGYPNFSSSSIFTYSGQPTALYINGTQIAFDANYPLTCHNEIAITYGSPPSTIPSSFDFTRYRCFG